MNSNSFITTNPEIKSNLLTIYDKIGMPTTREVGFELFIDLILNNIYSSQTINYIISQVGDFINSLNSKEKEPYLKLLSLIFYNRNQQEKEDDKSNNYDNPIINKNIYYIYLSPVLNILQLLIKEQNLELFPAFSEIYAEIVQNILPTDISVSTRKLNMEEKKAYEIVQGFCIYNMKYDDKANKVVGSLCLTKLVENCPIVLQSQYTKFIWDNINNFIDKKNFNAKYELLNCLISLILGTENLFCPYANVTLYKVLDFLTDNDWHKRKLALNVIYTLIFYCKEEIMPLKDHIINFLRVLKTDKVKEVREVCLLILQIFSENEPKKEKQIENYSVFSDQKTNKHNKRIKNDLNSNKTKEKAKNKNVNKSSFSNNIKDNENENNIDDNYQNLEKNNKIDESERKVSKNKKYEFNVDRGGEEERERDRNNSINRAKTPVVRKRSIGEEGSNINSNINHNKFVNRKDDNTFVNEKMKIRPDPNKSIFKTSPNSAFFNQAKNKNNDIIVMAKGDPKKYDYNIKEKQITKESPTPLSSNKKNNFNNTQPIFQNKPKKPEINNLENETNNENNFNKSSNNKRIYKIDDDRYENKDENITEYNDNDVRTKYNKNRDRNLINQKKEVNYIIDENKSREINDVNTKNKSNNNFRPINNNKKFDSVLLNKLLSQMNSLSAKQLSLIDAMENIQNDAQQQISSLNEKIFSLDSIVDELTSELNELRSQNI